MVQKLYPQIIQRILDLVESFSGYKGIDQSGFLTGMAQKTLDITQISFILQQMSNK